jgi:MFS family permease
MWILMLLLEVPLVALSGAAFRRHGGRRLLAVGVAAGALRWLVCGWIETPWIIYAVQLLHGVTVAGLIIGAPLYAESVVPHRLRSTAQGMVAMTSVSLGGITSSLLAGWLIDHVGPLAPAQAGGVGALLLTLIVALVPPPESAAGSHLLGRHQAFDEERR